MWAWLLQLWSGSGWRSVLIIVKPETVIAQQRQGFRRYWAWKSRQGWPGRPEVSREVRDLIRKIRVANPLWEHRIHGEFLKLGIELSQTTVAKYIVRRQHNRCGTGPQRGSNFRIGLPVTLLTLLFVWLWLSLIR